MQLAMSACQWACRAEILLNTLICHVAPRKFSVRPFGGDPQDISFVFCFDWVCRSRRRCSISKRNITSASASVTTEGRHKNSATPSTRMLRTNSTTLKKNLSLKFLQGKHSPPSVLLKPCTHQRGTKQNEGKPSQTATMFTLKQN